VYNDNFYNQNDASNKSTKTKVKKVVDRELELKSQKQRKIYLKQLQMGLQEGAGGESSTVLCFPKGMHVAPGTMPQLLVTRSRQLQDWKHSIVS